jgi:sigma-B regulation protein RsbU (phosphoserine phosphatase)
LSAGSRLVFYSDGITEAADASDDEYGLSRLQEHFRKPGSSADSILKDVHEFTAPSPLLDDATVIVVNLERDIISQA